MSLMLLQQAQGLKPVNVVIMLSDDLGLRDVGPYGATLIKTPRLNQLAQEGVALKNFYSCANTCTPSRGGLLTGHYRYKFRFCEPKAFTARSAKSAHKSYAF